MRQVDVSTVRVRTRETIAHPDIAQLIMRGARACGFPTPAAVLAELVQQVTSHGVGIFVGLKTERPEKNKVSVPCAVVIGHLPVSAFHLAPTVSLAYSERAPRQIVAAVGARLRAWLLECGHDHALAINMRHTDRAFMLGFGHFGAAEPAGSVIRFSF